MELLLDCVSEIKEFVKISVKLELIKIFERVFHLFDINGTGLVSKSEIAYNLLQIKDIVSDKLDLTLIENFEAFQVD
jgi:Ca2+-binding EF-hand superfamily protein